MAKMRVTRTWWCPLRRQSCESTNASSHQPFTLSQSQHSGLQSHAFLAATPSTMPAVKASQTFPDKAFFPQSNRIDTAAHRSTGLGLTVAGRQTQNDLRARGLSHASASTSGSTLQHFSLRRRNHDTFRHPLFLQQQPINNQCNSALVLLAAGLGSVIIPRFWLLVFVVQAVWNIYTIQQGAVAWNLSGLSHYFGKL